MNEEKTLRAATAALRMVCVSLPHLSGLAHLARVEIDRRVPSAGIFASGRMMINPDWFEQLAFQDQVFVAAHELLHLALRSHERGAGTDQRLFNVAHDYIINDMLVEALGRGIPAGGMAWSGARHMSAEHIVQRIRWKASAGCLPSSWDAPSSRKTALSDALSKAGLSAPETESRELASGVDALSNELERRWFPGVTAAGQARMRHLVQIQATKAAGLAALQGAMVRLDRSSPAGNAIEEQAIEALQALYHPPWELALQQWMEAVAPASRSYARPSRRGADRLDLALAGRKREGWTLHILLDTSGSMSNEFSRVLGAIALFCETANVAEAHILQCDENVTRDEFLSPQELSTFTVAGYGGSDMTPGLWRLAEDPEVEAAMVITDGQIHYPDGPMPYHVLWTLVCEQEYFEPPYGQVLRTSFS